jgi:hypothetical protein
MDIGMLGRGAVEHGADDWREARSQLIEANLDVRTGTIFTHTTMIHIPSVLVPYK